MDAQLLTQADLTLSKCGRPVPPDGVRAVDIPHSLVYNAVLPANVLYTLTGYRSVPGETVFMLRAFSIVGSTTDNCYIRIQFPDGTFLSNSLDSMSLNALVGSYRRSLSKEVACPVGSQITVVLDTSTTGAPSAVLPVAITFEGVYRYLLKNGKLAPATPAEAARYSRTPNGNILAPEMMLDTYFLEIPDSARRGPYTMVSQPASIGTPGGTVTIQIPASSSYDFLIRRFCFEQTFSGNAAGETLVRPRDGSGYALFSDYAPIAQVQDAPYAKDWCIRAGVALYFDFLFRNTAGAGNVTFVVNAIGARQRRAA
jgi:hypothetical protein